MQNEKPDTGPKTIGLRADVTLVGINGDNLVKAKIDTGAQECSLDAQNLEQNVDEVSGSGSVSFTFGEYQYKMAIAGFQAISSADGGTQNRPTIKLGVRLGEEYIPDVIFNLNDRSGMDFPVLLGVSFLQAAKLNVDPSLDEDIEITFLDDPEQKNQNTSEIPPAVVDSSEVEDNTSSDFDLTVFATWYEANKDKTLSQILAGLIKPGTTTDETS